MATKGAESATVSSSNPKAIIFAKNSLKSVTTSEKIIKKSKKRIKIVYVNSAFLGALIKFGIKL